MEKKASKIPLKNSISFRLSIGFMLIVTAVVLLLSFSFVFLLRYSITKHQKEDLYKASEVLEKNYILNPDFEPELLSIPYYVLFSIYKNDDGTIIYSNDPFIPNLPDSNGHTKKYFQKDFYTDGNLNILYYSVLVDQADCVIQTAIDIDRDSSNDMINGIPNLAAITLIPILIISFLISLLITKRTIRPVEKITDLAAEMSSTNLNSLLPVSKNKDELDYLAKTFNKLFENIRVDFEQERNFTSNVSHELKTPIAGILGQAKLLQRWGKDDPKQLEQSLGLIIQEAESMNSIVTNLLQISKLETGHEQIFKEELNPKILFNRLKEEFTPLSKNLEFEIETEDFTFTTDIELLHQVLTALISNSIKFHSKAELEYPCKIKLFCKKENNKIIIKESDNGPGIEPEVLPHIFERFYRGDPSHNRNSGGAGLGLSIASTIVKALNGTITAENKTEGNESGAIFTLTF